MKKVKVANEIHEIKVTLMMCHVSNFPSIRWG